MHWHDLAGIPDDGGEDEDALSHDFIDDSTFLVAGLDSPMLPADLAQHDPASHFQGGPLELPGIDPLLAQQLDETNAVLAECDSLLESLNAQQAAQPHTDPNLEFASALNANMGHLMSDVNAVMEGDLSDAELTALLEEYQGRAARLDAMSGALDASTRMRHDALQSMQDLSDRNTASQYRIWESQEQTQADAALEGADLAARRGEDATGYLQQFMDSTDRADYYGQVARDYTPEDE